eukprot:COSAG06_NODE_3414_length_5376_cov_4.196513_1_plen_1512_part_10
MEVKSSQARRWREMQQPANMPAVPAAALRAAAGARPSAGAGGAERQQALRQFLEDKGLAAYCDSIAEAGVGSLGQLRLAVADAAAMPSLVAATRMPKGHQMRLRKALASLPPESAPVPTTAGAAPGRAEPTAARYDEASTAAVGPPSSSMRAVGRSDASHSADQAFEPELEPQLEPEPEPEPVPERLELPLAARASTRSQPPVLTRFDDASERLRELEADSAQQSALENQAREGLRDALAAAAETARENSSTSFSFDLERVGTHSQAAAEHISAVKSHGRNQLAAMSSQVTETAGGDARVRAGLADYQSAMESRWESDELALMKLWIKQREQRDEEEQQSQQSKREHQVDVWHRYFVRSSTKLYLRKWRMWSHARASLALEGEQALEKLMAEGDGAGRRQADGGEIVVLTRQISKYRQKERRQKSAKQEDESTSVKLRRVVDELQTELVAVTNAAIVVQEKSKRMNRRHVAERLALYSDTETLGRQADVDQDTENAVIHVGGLEGQLESESLLEEVFSRFGTVLAATLRTRRETDSQGRKTKVSWALVSFQTEADAQRALAADAELSREFKSQLVMKTIDETQVVKSTGSMGAVMRKHVQGRMEKRMRANQELRRTQTAPASTKATTSLDMNDTIVLLRLRLRAEAIDESGPNPRLLLKAYGQGSSKRLAVEDFGKMVRRHGFQEATDADLTRIFKQIDANKDGVLSADEMHTFLWPPVDMVQGGKGISSEIMEGIAIVKRKFQAASYVGGGQDFKKLWVQINVDEGAYMEYIDFAAAVRRHGVSAHLISDKVLERIFESIFVTMSPERRTAGLASGVPGKEGIDQVAFEKFMSTNGKTVQHYAPVETVFDKMMQRSRMGGALRRWRDKVWDLFDLRELMAKMMANASRSLMRNMFLRWERNARRIDKLQAASEVLAKSHQLYAKVAALNVVKQVKSIRKEIDELKVNESDDIVGLSLRHQKDMEAMRTQAAAAAAEARAQMEELQEQLHTAQHEASENRTKWRQLEAALKDERDATAADTQERGQAYRALQMQKDDAVDKANQLQDSMSALEATFTGNLTTTSLAATIADKQAAHDKSEQLEAELRELRVAHEAELQTLRSEMSRSDTDYSRQHEEGLVRLTELQRLSDQHKREADQQIIEQQLRFTQNVARRLATEIARASHGLLGSSFWVWQNEAKVAKRCKAAMNRFVLALSRRTLAMAWNSWFDLYRMHVRRMRQLEQVTRIWIRSGTSKAWYAWCYASVRWRRLKRIMGQLGASAKVRRTYIAFDIWKTTVIRDGKTRAMLGKSVSGLIDRNVLAALRTWKAETSQARRAKALLERAITRIACLLLSQAFSRWTAYVYERCRLRLICTRALTRLTDTLLATAFNSWKLQQSATASHKKRLLWAEKFVSTIQQRVVASAFSGWHDSMCKLQRGRTIATRALKRMRDIHLYEAIVQWRGNVVEIRRRQMLLDSMVRRLRSKTLWDSFVMWTRMLHKKALLERAITRIACLLLSQAFSRWTAYVYERCR